MERFSFLKHPVFVIFTSFVLLFSLFKFGPKLPISVTTQEKGTPMVVSGTGKVTAIPDIATVSLGIEESGYSLKEAQTQVNTKSKSLTSTLKKMGIDEKDIKTTSYNVYPEYDFSEALSFAYESTPQKIKGYRVSTDYTVKVRDFDKINDVLVKATEVGVNSIGGINFEVNEETKKEKLQEAREEAVKEVKEKAQGLAKAAGISLGKVINVSESQGYSPQPLYAMERIDAAPGVATKPDIQPGETEISVTVSLSYEIR
ncbi:MAG: SIMPL domain-containing protein [bacterium]